MVPSPHSPDDRVHSPVSLVPQLVPDGMLQLCSYSEQSLATHVFVPVQLVDVVLVHVPQEGVHTGAQPPQSSQQFS